MNIGRRTIGLIFMIAVGASGLLALSAPSLATAEITALCKKDVAESFCPEGSVATHIHLVMPGAKAKLLTTFNIVECDILYLGDTLSESGAPLIINGQFTFTNCGSCAVTEESEFTKIEILKEGHETTSVTGEFLIYIVCGELLDCSYHGTGLVIAGKGPLLSAESHPNGELSAVKQIMNKEPGGFLCPETSKLDLVLEPLEALYVAKGAPPSRTALCEVDEAGSTCFEEHKLGSADFKDSAVQFLTSLLNPKCEGLISGSVGVAGEPQEAKVESTYSGCTKGCAITETSADSQLFFLHEGSASSESAAATAEGLELSIQCGATVKCTFGPIKLSGDILGALVTSDKGHITFDKASLGKGEGSACPSTATLDALFVASSSLYVREDYVKPKMVLCAKDEGAPLCKSENQIKSIDYKDKAVELLTNLINIKCEGLISGAVGEPGNPLEIKPELTYTGCSGGCFVTSVAGPGKVLLEREGKTEEAKATSEGFEIFVKCGTTIQCLLGPEKMAGTALGALTTGDNGHLAFSKVSMGKGEGAICPKEATLDALYVASSAAYIG